MTHVPIARGSHSVRFFDNERRAWESIAEYFCEEARLDDFCIMIARPGTFAGVCQVLASDDKQYSGALAIADRIRFIDADESLAQFMVGEAFNREHAEEFFLRLLSRVPASSANARVRLYGEAVDVLCERGQHAIAVQIEDLAGLLFAIEPRLSILCGYDVKHFAGDSYAASLRALCGKHTDIGPLHDPTAAVEAQGEKTSPPGVVPSADVSLTVVYVVDDDASMRRSLARLLTLSHWRVRTFDSAEAFLKEADSLSTGCLVVDIQLGGMTGLDLMIRLTERGFRLPVIAMSGFHDERFEGEATRLGACAFLHKPFEPQTLLDAIARALDRPQP